MNYDVLFWADTAITAIIIIVWVIGIWCVKGEEGAFYKLCMMLAAVGVIWWFISGIYNYTLTSDSVMYGYKTSIEQGYDNGYTNRFYEMSGDEKKNILDSIKKANWDKGKIGYEYGYSYTDSSKRYFDLYFTSMWHLKGMPLFSIVGLLGVVCMGCFTTTYVIKTISYRNEYRKKIDSEIEQRDRELQQIVTMKTSADREVKALRAEKASLQISIDRSKADYEACKKREDELSDKTAEYNKLVQQLMEINSQIQEKKEEVKSINHWLVKKQQQVKVLDRKLEEKREQLQVITNSVKAAESLNNNHCDNDAIDLNNIFGEKSI